jgi:hypothetical protein
MLVFGGDGARNCGVDLCGVDLNDLWALNFTNTMWEQLSPMGTPPLAREFAAGVYDPLGDRLIVFGGSDHHGNVFNDVWALSLQGTPTWTQLTPQGTPPDPRSAPAAIYDPRRARLVIFGGIDLHGASRNDTWALSLTGPPVWTLLQPAGVIPAARAYTSGVYDPSGDRLVICDGWTSFFHVLRDTWGLSLAGAGVWSPLTPAGPVPAGRSDLAAIYDSAHARLVIFGGTDSSYTVRNDAWALTFDQPTAAVFATGVATALPGGVRLEWHLSGVPSAAVTVLRRAASGAWQPLARVERSDDGRVDYLDGTGAPGVAYAYALLLPASGLVVGEVIGAAGEAAPALLCYPNPSRSAVTVRLYLREAVPGATLRVFDAAGRESLHRVLGVLEPGLHEIALPSSARLPAGQYAVQCQSANAVTRGTLTRLR